MSAIKSTYEQKQLFKYRFWKHIFELDYDALSDLLEEGNPVGHLNFPFCVPSDRHGFNFIPALSVQDNTGDTDNPLIRDDCKDHGIRQIHDMNCNIHETNMAIHYYLCSNGKQVSEILGIWNFEPDENRLPTGAHIDDDIPYMILCLLCQHGLSTSARWIDYVGEKNGFRVELSTVFGGLLVMDWCDNFERMLESKDHSMREEYYQLALLEHPEDFNRLVDVYPLASYDELHAWCDKDEDVTKRLWKLRLSRLDPTRWPTFEDVPDVSREELEAMFSGHPSQVQLTDMCEEPPCKRICT